MPSTRGIERFGGILLILMLVTSVSGAVFAGAVGTDYNVPADEVADVLQLVAGNQGLHQAEIGFDLATFVILVALSGALYLAFSPHNRLLALLGTLGLAAGGIILTVHDVFWFAFPSVAIDFVSASGSRVEVLLEIGRVTMLTANWGLSVGITFMGLGILAYGVLMIWSGAVPRGLGWLGAVAGVLLFTGTWLPRIDVGLYAAWTALAAPVLLWELGLGLWLLIKGTNQAGELALRHP
ncbi:MAG: DUF4386 domain-containing protein [Planctomycetales bacterium]